MTRDTDIRDETLKAYLDGMLTRAKANMVADALVDSPHLAARLRGLEVPIEDLIPPLDTMRVSLPRALRNTTAATCDAQQAISPRITVLAAVALFAAGLGVGAYWPRDTASGPPSWHASAAAAQALYTTDTLNVVTPPSAQIIEAHLRQISIILGRNLHGALDVPGLTYTRAQVLEFEGKPLVQLAYLSDTGTPVALYVLVANEIAPHTTLRLEGLQAASWSDGSYAYLLIGGQDATVIAQAASQLQAAF